MLTDSYGLYLAGKLSGRASKRGETERSSTCVPSSLGGEFTDRLPDREEGRTDHGHVRGLLGPRGTATRGLRRGTTPAPARPRFPDTARGE